MLMLLWMMVIVLLCRGDRQQMMEAAAAGDASKQATDTAAMGAIGTDDSQRSGLIYNDDMGGRAMPPGEPQRWNY